MTQPGAVGVSRGARRVRREQGADRPDGATGVWGEAVGGDPEGLPSQRRGAGVADAVERVVVVGAVVLDREQGVGVGEVEPQQGRLRPSYSGNRTWGTGGPESTSNSRSRVSGGDSARGSASATTLSSRAEPRTCGWSDRRTSRSAGSKPGHGAVIRDSVRCSGAGVPRTATNTGRSRLRAASASRARRGSMRPGPRAAASRGPRRRRTRRGTGARTVARAAPPGVTVPRATASDPRNGSSTRAPCTRAHARRAGTGAPVRDRTRRRRSGLPGPGRSVHPVLPARGRTALGY